MGRTAKSMACRVREWHWTPESPNLGRRDNAPGQLSALSLGQMEVAFGGFQPCKDDAVDGRCALNTGHSAALQARGISAGGHRPLSGGSGRSLGTLERRGPECWRLSQARKVVAHAHSGKLDIVFVAHVAAQKFPNVHRHGQQGVLVLCQALTHCSGKAPHELSWPRPSMVPRI